MVESERQIDPVSMALDGVQSDRALVVTMVCLLDDAMVAGFYCVAYPSRVSFGPKLVFHLFYLDYQSYFHVSESATMWLVNAVFVVV